MIHAVAIWKNVFKGEKMFFCHLKLLATRIDTWKATEAGTLRHQRHPAPCARHTPQILLARPRTPSLLEASVQPSATPTNQEPWQPRSAPPPLRGRPASRGVTEAPARRGGGGVSGGRRRDQPGHLQTAVVDTVLAGDLSKPLTVNCRYVLALTLTAWWSLSTRHRW
jgi:hypothetical protein